MILIILDGRQVPLSIKHTYLSGRFFINFLTNTLLRAQNTMLLSKVRQIFFSNFVAFSENPNFKKTNKDFLSFH